MFQTRQHVVSNGEGYDGDARAVYLNPDIVDLGAAREMVGTVEDPNRHVNREIARWIKDRDRTAAGWLADPS
jgi:hypothetical protein